MPKQKSSPGTQVDRTICPRCNIGPMNPGKKGSFKATCPKCGDEWNFDIMSCPDCHVLLWREGRGKYICFKCGFTPMKEAILRAKVKQHYIGQGYEVKWESGDNSSGADFIFYKNATRYIVVVEAKGENPSQINGLMDVQKALGQIIEHMDNPRGTNADILEPYAKLDATFIYAVAVPCTRRYLDWCNARVSQSTRKKLNLHWLFVERTGQVNPVDPNHIVTEVICT